METKQQVILSVDDNDVDGALLERAFKRCALPCRLFRVSEGPQALSYLSGEGIYCDRASYPIPDLILLDLAMPKMSGLEVLNWIRQQPELKKTTVLIFTSSENPEDVKTATKIGANGYLIKPTKFEDLKNLVKEIYTDWLDKTKKPKPSVKKAKNGSKSEEGAPVAAESEQTENGSVESQATPSESPSSSQNVTPSNELAGATAP
ncbi:MAG: response regulator [Verrucomicrobiota bacterium]|nr:response regulator [Verrucomicrobiota bacterium]